MNGPRKISPLHHEESSCDSDSDVSWADLHDAIAICRRESLESYRRSSVDTGNTHASACSFASSAQSSRNEDLAPVRARPRTSFSSQGWVDIDSLPKEMSLNKQNGRKKGGEPSWDHMNDDIERAMHESLHLSQGDLQFDASALSDSHKKNPTASLNPGEGPWSCSACTFLNENPLHLVCGVCGTAKASAKPPLPATVAAGLNSSFTSVGSQSSRIRPANVPARYKTEERSSFSSQSSHARKPAAEATAAATSKPLSISGSENSISIHEINVDDEIDNENVNIIENGKGDIKTDSEASIRSQGSNPQLEDLRGSLLSPQDKMDDFKSTLTKKNSDRALDQDKLDLKSSSKQKGRHRKDTAGDKVDDGLRTSIRTKGRTKNKTAPSTEVNFQNDSFLDSFDATDLEPSQAPKEERKASKADLHGSFESNQTSSSKAEEEYGDSLRSLKNELKFRHQHNMSAKGLRRSNIESTDDTSMTSASSRRSGRLVRSYSHGSSEIESLKNSKTLRRGSKGYRRSSVDSDIRDDASLMSDIMNQSYYSYSDDDDRTMRTMQTIKSLRVPEKEATIIFTDVQGSTSLWEAHPLSMKKATDVHDSIIRKCYSEHSGYEISTEGDSFNLAFQHPADAIGFALKAQLALYKANWPEEILSHEDGNFNEKRAFRGFRVRMGMHHGPVESFVHETTGRTIYQGEAVDIAKSIEKMSHGGQILTTVETWRAVSGMAEEYLGKPQVMDCGEHLLYDPKKKPKTKSKGKMRFQSKRILQLVPNQLSYDFFAARGGQEVKEGEKPQTICGRVFPPLLSHGQLSTSFLNAPFAKNRVAMVFVYTDKMELAFDNERKRNQKYLAKYIRKNLMQLSPPGYECQEDKGSWMLAFDRTENGIKFALELNETVSKSDKLRGDIDKEKLFRIGIHWGPFLSMGPHTITGHADYFGPIVNRAARVAAQCEPGQVCVGIPMDADEEPPDPGPTVEIEVLGVKQLKGITTEMAIFSCRKRTVESAHGGDETEKKSDEKVPTDKERHSEKHHVERRKSSMRRSALKKDP